MPSLCQQEKNSKLAVRSFNLAPADIVYTGLADVAILEDGGQTLNIHQPWLLTYTVGHGLTENFHELIASFAEIRLHGPILQ